MNASSKDPKQRYQTTEELSGAHKEELNQVHKGSIKERRNGFGLPHWGYIFVIVTNLAADYLIKTELPFFLLVAVLFLGGLIIDLLISGRIVSGVTCLIVSVFLYSYHVGSFRILSLLVLLVIAKLRKVFVISEITSGSFSKRKTIKRCYWLKMSSL